MFLGENDPNLITQISIPKYIEFIPSNGGGPKSGVHILKCGSRFYRNLTNHVTKSTVNLTCYKRRFGLSSANLISCPFRCTLKFLKILDPKADGFHDPSNFIIKPCIPFAHTCDGFKDINEARMHKAKMPTRIKKHTS